MGGGFGGSHLCKFFFKMRVCVRVFGDQCGSSSSLPRQHLPHHPDFLTSTATEITHNHKESVTKCHNMVRITVKWKCRNTN